MRGGVCYNSKRYSKASNNYLKSFDPKEKSRHIMYLNANDLYGYAMSKFLDLNELTVKSFSKLILNILKNYGNCITIILWVQIK